MHTYMAYIKFSSIDKPIKAILVTSPEASTGKTSISSNLAAIYAQKGKKVLLLDADLRRPQVHKAMGTTNHLGLTDLLRGSHDLQDVIQKVDGLENLTIISSGSLPPNPAELLGSARMEQILLELGSNYDIIVVDSPPSVVADSQILSSKADAVLVVLQPGKTSKEAAKATGDLIKRAGGHIIGVVFNRIPRDRVDYYSGNYQYYSKD